MAARVKASQEVLRFRHGGVPSSSEELILNMAERNEENLSGDNEEVLNNQYLLLRAKRMIAEAEERNNVDLVRRSEQALAGRGNRSSGDPSISISEPGQGEQYQQSCDRQGCSFKTIRSTNPLAYGGIIAELQLHYSDKHSVGEKDPVNMGHTHRQAFLEATKKIELPAGPDDRVYLFHKGRYLMGPLDPKAAAKQSPLFQQPVFGRLDLYHIGIRIGNEKTVKAAHDRGNKSIKLQMFSPRNLGMSSAEQRRQMSMEGGALIEGKEFKDLKTPAEAMLAAHAYSELDSFLHPMCYGSKAMFRMLFEKYVAGNITSVAPIMQFFMTVQHENANRACCGCPPLTYEELIPKWEGFKTSTSTSNKVDGAIGGGKYSQDQVKGQVDRLQKEVNALKQLKGVKRDGGPANKRATDKRRKGGMWCEL